MCRLLELDAFLHADFAYMGERVAAVDISNPQLVPKAYQVANLKLGTRLGSWRIALYADNLFDEVANFAPVPTLGIKTLGRLRIVVNRPRTSGSRLALISNHLQVQCAVAGEAAAGVE